MKKITFSILIFLLSFSYSNLDAQFVVNTSVDIPFLSDDVAPGDGVCLDGTGMCSLRAAIMESNANPGADVIQFNIQPLGFVMIQPAGPPVINNGGLPMLTDNAGVTIDGLTQPDPTGATASCDGNVPNHNLYIEIDGSLAPNPPGTVVHGFWVASDNNVIKGLIINNFTGDGVRIDGGAAGPNFSNHADNNLINCNIIGTGPAGTLSMGNGTASIQLPPPAQSLFFAGVTIKNTFLGDSIPTNSMSNIVDANLISSNTFEGVQINGPFAPGDVGSNQVLNNFIGTDLAGLQPLGNARQGVNMSEGTHDNYISNNLISGNGWDGVGIQGFDNIGYTLPSIFTRKNVIANNWIGVDNSPGAFNALPNGNNGVSIGLYGTNTWGYADSNEVLNNTIWYNAGAGIGLWEHTGQDLQYFNAYPFKNTDHNFLSLNSIWQNGGLGIDIEMDGVTMNDPADPDSLSNQQLNFPVLQSVAVVGPNATITGTCGTKASNIEVYLTNPDPSGYGEGKTYLGSATPAGGSWTLNVGGGLVSSTSVVTAIAQDAGKNTSEFGLNLSAPLALDLIAFNASPKNNHVLLDWLLESEQDVMRYYVHRATDPYEFAEIASLPCGRSVHSNQQFYEDYNVIPGIVYFYKIGVENEQGEVNFTPIKTALLGGLSWTIYPNPVMEDFLRIQFGKRESGVLELIANDGRILKSVNISNQFEIKFNLETYPEGHYWIRFTNEQKTMTERVVVL